MTSHNHRAQLAYEMMKEALENGGCPIPWWVRRFNEHKAGPFYEAQRDENNKEKQNYNSGVFPSALAAFYSNAHYRYWDMLGVKGQDRECLVGQAGELEPADGIHTISFFLAQKTQAGTWKLHFPQDEENGILSQSRDPRLPIITTKFEAANCKLSQKALAGVVKASQSVTKAVVVVKLEAKPRAADEELRLGIAITPYGPSGFGYHPKSNKFYQPKTRRVEHMSFDRKKREILVAGIPALLFNTEPTSLGLYSTPKNVSIDDVTGNDVLEAWPFRDLMTKGTLNEKTEASDFEIGLCCAAFLWDIPASGLEIELTALIDEFHGHDDVSRAAQHTFAQVHKATTTFWQNKLNEGLTMQGALRSSQTNPIDLSALYSTCRVNLLTLTDNAEVHPGPTNYDHSWIRDASISCFATALAGDRRVAERQVDEVFLKKQWHNRYLSAIKPLCKNHLGKDQYYNLDYCGFFGGDKEKHHDEWDANGQAIWTIGVLDRIYPDFGLPRFGRVLEGVGWIGKHLRSHHSSNDELLPPGWSAEHLGPAGRRYFWDNFWALGGLQEAARLAERNKLQKEMDYIWSLHHRLKTEIARSIETTINFLRRNKFQDIFIPASPDQIFDAQLQSTMIGTLAYFHPCKLFRESDLHKMYGEIDQIAIDTVDLIASKYTQSGGFKHNSRDWHGYGSYLTTQLAHTLLILSATVEDQAQERHQAFLRSLDWVAKAAYPTTKRESGPPITVVSGAWNEQHCYQIAGQPLYKDFWYMGDIPHGWGCAEYMLLLRSMLFFEEDVDRAGCCLNIGAGLCRETFPGDTITIKNAPTLFGTPISFEIHHEQAAHRLKVTMGQPLEHVPICVHCHFGRIETAKADTPNPQISPNKVKVKKNTKWIEISY